MKSIFDIDFDRAIKKSEEAIARTDETLRSFRNGESRVPLDPDRCVYEQIVNYGWKKVRITHWDGTWSWGYQSTRFPVTVFVTDRVIWDAIDAIGYISTRECRWEIYFSLFEECEVLELGGGGPPREPGQYVAS